MAPSSAATPALPPSVEEAYRRKCIQLKQRTAEVEEANEASRLRLARLNRQAEKMRIERAFLLEQLSKRISTNVEDSDGSPSPPPTPKEKPLRTKRGHRKMSANPGGDPAGAPGSTFISQTSGGGLGGGSPAASDALSHTNADSQSQRNTGANGKHLGPPRVPSTAFELYCRDIRPSLEADKAKEAGDKAADKDKDKSDKKQKDKDTDDMDADETVKDEPSDKGKDAAATAGINEELERRWKDLPEADRDEFQARYEKDLAKYEKDKDAYEKKQQQGSSKDDDEDDEDAADRAPSSSAVPIVKVERPADEPATDTPGGATAQDEDVEMTNYDTEPEAGDKE
ncbi:hypothetical protein RB595_000468 [Gaeumannomyces hyphopodioides]